MNAREAEIDRRTTADLERSSSYERDHDEWRAVDFTVDESDFAPEILPEDVSEAFDVITEPVTVRRGPMRARLSTGVAGWTILEED